MRLACSLLPATVLDIDPERGSGCSTGTVHFAFKTDPAMVAAIIRDWITS